MGKLLNKLVHPHHGILLCNKKEQAIGTCNNLDVSSENYADWEKSIPKDYILYNSIYITFLKCQNYTEEEQISGCQWLGTRVVEGDKCSYKEAAQEMLATMKLLFVMTVVVITCMKLVISESYQRIMSMSISCTIVMWDFTIGENRVNSTGFLCIS